VGLPSLADRWARSPLAAKVALVSGGGELFAILGTPRMLLGTVHKWPSPRLFDSINSKVSDVASLTLAFHNLL
jgi:hypothetical protein